MPHPLEVGQAISKHIGKEVYLDDVDVVLDDDNAEQPTIGHVMLVTGRTYTFMPFNEDRSGYGESYTFTI